MISNFESLFLEFLLSFFKLRFVFLKQFFVLFAEILHIEISTIVHAAIKVKCHKTGIYHE